MPKKYLIVGFGGSGKRAFGIFREIYPYATVKILNTGGENCVEDTEPDAVLKSLEDAVAFQPTGVFMPGTF